MRRSEMVSTDVGRAALLVALCLVAAHPAAAVHPEDAAVAELEGLRDRIDEGDAAGAERALRSLLAERPADADVLNLLGYAARKLSRLEESRAFYVRALAIDPAHRGALEYMGELELQVGDVAAARRLRDRLERACAYACPELRDLEDAFAARGVSLAGDE